MKMNEDGGRLCQKGAFLWCPALQVGRLGFSLSFSNTMVSNGYSRNLQQLSSAAILSS